MSFITIILFFVYTWGLGFGLLDLVKVKQADNEFEKQFMRIGVGLGVFPVIVVLFSLLHIPLYWWLFLILSLVMPILRVKSFKVPKIGLTKANIYSLIMLVLFAFSLFMYTKGAFAYPYLEDDDPWSHALGVSYIVETKSIREPIDDLWFQYFDPYPPGYDGLMGVLQQTSNNIMFTLKFFNALIISLGTIFFYYFSKRFMRNSKKALFATFCLAMVPAFLSHFIWAISLAVILYFVAFYATLKIEDESKWWIVAAFMVGGTLLLTPTHSTYFGLFFLLYFITLCVVHRKFMKYEFLAGLVGLGLSMIWWIPTIVLWGYRGAMEGVGLGGQSVFKVAGTGDKSYALSDFIFAQSQNMINSPIGIGIFISILIAVFLVSIFFTYKQLKEKKNHWVIISFVWLIFTFYAVNAAKMPIKISPFRTWMLLAIPVCLLAAQGLWFLFAVGKSKGLRTGLLFGFIVGIIFTSGVHKYNLNTAQWPPGAFWGNMEEIDAYLWLQETNLRPYTFIAAGAISGIGKYYCVYCDDMIKFSDTGPNQTIEEYTTFLRNNDFDSIIISALDAKHYNQEVVVDAMQRLADSDKFTIAFQNNGALILQLA